MKRVFIALCSVILALSMLTVPAFAQCEVTSDEIIISRSVEYLEDGSYIEIVVAEEVSDAATYATTTKSGSKTYTGRDSDGSVQWKFTLKGTFSVNTGVSATCTSVSYSTSDIASGWSLDSASTSKSGAKAMADFVFKKKVLFVTTKTIEGSLTLTCDKNGNLS